MNRIPVSSSNIVSIGYDKQSAILEVEFSSGSIYQYFDVSEYLHNELMQASSFGGFLNDNIVKYHYRYIKIK